MFWFGDLNFRIESLDIRFVKYAIDSNILSQLWEKDQVRGMGMLLSLGRAPSGVQLLPKLPVQLWDRARTFAAHGAQRALALLALWGRGSTVPGWSLWELGTRFLYQCARKSWGSMDLLLAWHGQTQELCGAGSSGAGMTVCWGWRGLGGLQRGLAMEAGALPDLLSFPQLNIAKSTWPVLSGFQEGPLNFPPTFKFDVGTNKYDSR